MFCVCTVSSGTAVMTRWGSEKIRVVNGCSASIHSHQGRKLSNKARQCSKSSSELHVEYITTRTQGFHPALHLCWLKFVSAASAMVSPVARCACVCAHTESGCSTLNHTHSRLLRTPSPPPCCKPVAWALAPSLRKLLPTQGICPGINCPETLGTISTCLQRLTQAYSVDSSTLSGKCVTQWTSGTTPSHMHDNGQSRLLPAVNAAAHTRTLFLQCMPCMALYRHAHMA